MDFAASSHAPGHAREVRVAGELDVYTAPRLREELLAALKQGEVDVVVDLTELEFIDSTGIGVLVAALKRARSMGGDVSLRAAPPAAVKVFELTGLMKVFTFLD